MFDLKCVQQSAQQSPDPGSLGTRPTPSDKSVQCDKSSFKGLDAKMCVCVTKVA